MVHCQHRCLCIGAFCALARGNDEADLYAKFGVELDVGECGRGEAIRDRNDLVKGALTYFHPCEVGSAAQPQQSQVVHKRH